MPQTKRPELQLTEFLPYRLNVLSKRISVALSEIYTEEFDITIPEWRVLLWTNTCDTLYAKDVCALTHMEKTQVSRVINQLEKRQLITRKMDDQDQRSYQLLLTPSGQALIDEIIPKAIAWEKQLITAISDPEYQRLMQAIEKLETQLDQLNTERSKLS